MSREEIESVGFEYGDLKAMTAKYDPEKLRHGYNQVDGEEIFFVANPGLGLWAHRSRFESAAGRNGDTLIERAVSQDANDDRSAAIKNSVRQDDMENQGLKLNKYSVGTGDRFAHQAKAQLQACIKALEHGVEVVPVWNKSNREHNIIGSEPVSRARRRPMRR